MNYGYSLKGYDDWLHKDIDERMGNLDGICTEELDCQCIECEAERNLADEEGLGDWLYEQEKDRRLGL